MWLAAVSVPLLPAVVMVTRRYGARAAALCHRALGRVLRLLRGRACVRSTHAFVFSRCTHGRADSVLETFDLYADTHPTLCISPQTAQALDAVLMRVRPLRVLELGMHCGYASVRMLRLMPPAGRLITVERDPLTADLGEEIILVSGFKHNQVLTSSSGEAIQSNQLLRSDGGSGESFDLVLMDHDPSDYSTDLLLLLVKKLLNPSGCTILLIKRNHQAAGLREALDFVRERPDWGFCIKSDLQFMMEVFYQCPSLTEDM